MFDEDKEREGKPSIENKDPSASFSPKRGGSQTTNQFRKLDLILLIKLEL